MLHAFLVADERPARNAACACLKGFVEVDIRLIRTSQLVGMVKFKEALVQWKLLPFVERKVHRDELSLTHGNIS